MRMTLVGKSHSERSREQLLMKIKEVHSTLKQQFAGFDFLSELKGLEVVNNLQSKHTQQYIQGSNT